MKVSGYDARGWVPREVSYGKESKRVKSKQKRKKGRRIVFPEVMQTRVPKHIREAILKDIKEMQKDGVYRSESDWVREAVIKQLRDKKLA